MLPPPLESRALLAGSPQTEAHPTDATGSQKWAESGDFGHFAPLALVALLALICSSSSPSCALV